MHSISQAEVGDLDELDGAVTSQVPAHHPLRSSTSLELNVSRTPHAPDPDEMQFVDQLISDNTRSPSKYATGKPYASNIPTQTGSALKPRKRMTAQRPLYHTQVLQTYTLPASDAGVPMSRTRQVREGSRSCDLLVQDSYRFTDERPFQPRTLKSNRKSKLVEFKYYTPPKRKAEHDADQDEVQTSARGRTQVRATQGARPETANTLASTTDLMNASIVSRDRARRESPHDVPALDISLDQDHLKWLKDQQTQARLRSGGRSPIRTPNGATVDLGQTQNSLGDTRQSFGDTRQSFNETRKGFGRTNTTALNTFTLHDSMHVSG